MYKIPIILNSPFNALYLVVSLNKFHVTVVFILFQNYVR